MPKTGLESSRTGHFEMSLKYAHWVGLLKQCAIVNLGVRRGSLMAGPLGG